MRNIKVCYVKRGLLIYIKSVVYHLKYKQSQSQNPHSQGTGHPVQPMSLASCFAETTQNTLHTHIQIFILGLPHSTFDRMYLWPADFI